MPAKTIDTKTIAKYVNALNDLHSKCETLAEEMAIFLDKFDDEDLSNLDEDSTARYEALSEAQSYLEGGQLSDACDALPKFR